MKRVVSLVVCAVSGCWSEDSLVDETFTQAEWDFLSTEFRLPEPDLCPVDGSGNPFFPSRDICDAAAAFGQILFFDKALSGPIKQPDPFLPPGSGVGIAGTLSCASCHDPKGFFIDTRSKPGNISAGAIHTKHNAMSVINTAFKSVVARQNCAATGEAFCSSVYSWTGAYADPGGVLNLAGTNAMNSTPQFLTERICANPDHLALYLAIFGTPPLSQGSEGDQPPRTFPPPPPGSGIAPACPLALFPHIVFTNVGHAFDAYTRRLQSVDSPFDRFVAGDHAALIDSERRGLKVFITTGMCIDCHRGPLLSDLRFHNTGVAQTGPFVPASDAGLGPDRFGEFLTPPLRHVVMTAPYMHAGQLATLAEVIDFYRRGGDDNAGRKDQRIQPLEITDDEARDLEAFLGSLTGNAIPDELATP